MRNKIDVSTLDLQDKVVTLKRVTKVVKGGRTFRFTALVVVGDENGHVGVGLGKATEIPDAIRKGKEDAMKNLIYVERNENNSIYHEIYGKFGSSSVLLKPAPEGTGIIAALSTMCISGTDCTRNIWMRRMFSRSSQLTTPSVKSMLVES